MGPHASRCLLSLIVVAGAALVASLIFKHTYVGVDDANIAMVYARNLSTGDGIVYNVGGERVEGFTSLLYVVLMALVFSVSPVPELALHGLTVLLVGVALFLLVSSVGALTAAGTGRPWLSPSQLVLIAWGMGSPAFIVWTTVSLMDTALWCFMFASAVAVVLSEIGQPSPSRFRLAAMAAVAGLMPVTRPEGFVAAPLLILAYGLGHRVHATAWRPVLTSLFVPAVAWLVAMVSLTVFRIAYFGFPLPNTYYAKVSADTLYNLAQGTRYLARFVATYPVMVVVLGAIAAGLVLNGKIVIDILRQGRLAAEPGGTRSLIRVAHFVVSVMSIVGLSLPVYGGGDHFEGFRFYQPIWPILVLPLILLGHDVGAAVGAAVKYDRRRLAWTAAIVSLPALFGFVAKPWPTQPQSALLDQFLIAEDGRRLGRSLNRIFSSARPYVAATAAGGVQYTYQGPVFDLLGLNHVGMGHSQGTRRGYKNHAAFDKDVFWSVVPPVVLPILCPGPIDEVVAAEEFNKLSDGILDGLFRDPLFQQRYRLAAVRGTVQRRIFDGDPFFFLPRWLPSPRLNPGAYRDPTLIAYLQPDVVQRIESSGWTVVLLSLGRPDRGLAERPEARGPCTRPLAGASL